MPLPIPFLSYLILIMSTSFILWLEKLFANNDSSVVIEKLRALGWQYLTSGSYKAVYSKQGVPYLIKVTHNDNSNKFGGGEFNALSEFIMPNMVRALPYLAYGQTEKTYTWNGETGSYTTAWGIQEKCKAVLYSFAGKFTPDRINKVRNLFRTNPDHHANNIGITNCGRWVQFD